MSAAKKIKAETGLRYLLKIHVTENGNKVVSDQVDLLRLDEKILKKIRIPGFGNGQIQELILNKKTSYRHLGLDYVMEIEPEKLGWK